MKWLYYRFIYRRLMRLAHRFNWHHTRTIYPDGDTMFICDWCGMRDVMERAAYRDRKIITAEQSQACKAATSTHATNNKEV